jgi:peptide/nickel transport system ATP-binding protein
MVAMSEPLVRAVSVKKYFPVRRSLIDVLLRSKQSYVRAVDNVSFEIASGEVFALVGESGSGKTTMGKLCLGIHQPTSGKLYFDGVDVSNIRGKEFREFRKSTQMIYQDPGAALNPRVRVGEAVREPLKFYGQGTSDSQKAKVHAIFERVGLSPSESFYPRFPHQLSGGQRQRVVIARALILEPKFVVADEPVAMVDVSVRAQIIELLLRLKEQFELTYLLITHDLAIAKYFADRIAIMYLGEIVEVGSRENIFKNAQHPYTQALISSVPVPDPKYKGKRIIVKGDIPSLINPPSGCRFHSRCPFARESCRTNLQHLEQVEQGHFVACEVKPFLQPRVTA